MPGNYRIRRNDLNKIKFGIKNVYYAAVTSVSSTGSLTYATPVAMPGAVSLSLSIQGDTSTFYADNIAYWTANANNGYQGDLELALIPDAFRTAILGETLDAKGFYVERSDDKQKEFALLFQFEGDENATRHCLYRCSASRPEVSGSTQQESIEPQTETLTLTAMARINDSVVKARAPYTASTTSSYASWFSAVQEPTVTP